MRLSMIGGGGFRTPQMFRALAADPDGVVGEIVLFDTDADRLAVIEAVIDQMRAAEASGPRGGAGAADEKAADLGGTAASGWGGTAASGWGGTAASGRPRVRTTTDLIEAVTGADFIFSAMRVGGTEARALDEEIALEHGVLGQETVGVGGMAYALRTIPEARHLAGVIAEHAPEAWVINFTNPAGVITQAMREQLGGRVVGICDSPISLVARIEDLTGSRATSFDYAGLNHAGWLRGLRGRPEGSDRVEDLLARVLGDEQLLNQLDEARLLGVDVIRSIGAIPNEYHYYYSHTREAHGRIAERVPRGRQLAEQQEAFYSAAAAEPERALELWLEALREREETYGAETRTDPATRRSAHEIELGGYQKVALQLMRVLSGVDGPTRMILNVPNSPGTGRLIRQLSRRAVIEVACDVSIDAIIPAPVGRLHSDLAGLLVQLKGCDELLLRATERKDPVAALRAFATHPLVDSLETARALLASYCERIPGVVEAIGAA